MTVCVGERKIELLFEGGGETAVRRVSEREREKEESSSSLHFSRRCPLHYNFQPFLYKWESRNVRVSGIHALRHVQHSTPSL